MTDTWRSLIRPTVDIPPDASAIHGITADAVADSPTFASRIDTIESLLRGRVLIAHNAKFDVKMLRQEFKRLGRDLGDVCQEYVCTWAMAKRIKDWMPNRKLVTVAEYYNVDTGTSHTALDDARACYGIFTRMLDDGINGRICQVGRRKRQPGDAPQNLPVRRPTEYLAAAPASVESSVGMWIGLGVVALLLLGLIVG